MRRLGLAVLAFSAVLSTDAIACTVLYLDPAGERQSDIRYQRSLRQQTDATFLAQTNPVFNRRGAILNTVVAISGKPPPRRAFLHNDTSDCLPRRPPKGLVIAFARRQSLADVGWRVWNWGRWIVVAEVRPSEVRDPGLVKALNDAARSMRKN